MKDPIQHKTRLLSVDALRGFDMLLIAGGGETIVRLKGVTGFGWIDWLADQLEHPVWVGFTFYDFIFPLFLFTSGIALSFSLQSGIKNGADQQTLLKKALVRSLILIALGIIDKNIPLNIFDPAHIRYGTVLGRIGVATFITTVIYLKVSRSFRPALVAGILVLYCIALLIVPVPGYGAGNLSIEGNLVGWIDRSIMPGILLQKIYDENAILTQLPALCLCVLGSMAGDLLQAPQSGKFKVTRLTLFGAAQIALGLVWGMFLPIIKHLWTSSFIVLTSGMAFIFLALFYWVIDIMGYRRWAFFFKVIGMNSLVIYLMVRFVPFDLISDKLFSGFYMHVALRYQPALNALGSLALVWIILYIMYRKKIFVKI